MQRPGLYEFMQKMHELFEIVIFTAGNKEYADGIIDSVGWKDFVSYRLYWEHVSLDEKENNNSESERLTFSE
jgi:TFIIF-interacting CTD phosphatase-like protein|tara:strand:- start:189 stop:404 length:216 start_codon:yes stop_codon:yes gene_type:complete